MGFKFNKKIKRVALYCAVIIIVLQTLLPFLWLIISSVTPPEELFEKARLLPSQLTFERYEAILLGKDITFRGASLSGATEIFQKALLNSFFIAGTVTILGLLFGSLAAYAHARFKFRGKNTFLYTAIFIQMLPAIAVIIPLFMLVRYIGLTNSYIILILVYLSLVLTYVIWIMSGFYKSIPYELEESAQIDGCSRLGTLFRIVLPLSLPGMVATGSLGFLTVWNEFFFALIFVNDKFAKTIPLSVGDFSTQFSIDYGMMAAGGVIAAFPPILLALLFQKYIVRGLTQGAVKG